MRRLVRGKVGVSDGGGWPEAVSFDQPCRVVDVAESGERGLPAHGLCLRREVDPENGTGD